VLKFNRNHNGFTLVEIIVVVSIITLLAILVLRTVIGQINKANDAKRKADLQKISIAFEDYYSDKDCYPDDAIIATCGGDALKSWGLNTIPCDPVFHTPYCYLPAETSPCYQKYRLLNTLKYLQDVTIKELGCDGAQYCGWEAECEAAGNRTGFNYGVSSLNTSLLNPNISVDITPPPLPTPGGGSWGCTPGGDCNNYGPGSPLCDYQFSNESCGNGLYCQYSIYRCSR
jgi:prepilin-type N-terminal cleavage/methylation domain-containing protein